MEIILYEEKFREQPIAVWEKSVRATHDFVKPEDLEIFKEIVSEMGFFSSFPVYCLVDDNKVYGFIGVENQSIQALFLEPNSIGKGYGKKLLEFALYELNADEVDVNEQNIHAVKFYSLFGFVSYQRIETSLEGKDYPLLKMKLKKLAK